MCSARRRPNRKAQARKRDARKKALRNEAWWRENLWLLLALLVGLVVIIGGFAAGRYRADKRSLPAEGQLAGPTRSSEGKDAQKPEAGSNRASALPTDLVQLCEDLTLSSHPELGRRTLADLEALLPSNSESLTDETIAEMDELNRVEAGRALAAYGQELLSHGEFEASDMAYRRALRYFKRESTSGENGVADLDRRKLLELQGLTQFRAAESENCRADANPFVCLVSRGSRGLFQDLDNIQMAIDHLTEVAEQDPENIRSRWILFLAALTIGQDARDLIDDMPFHEGLFESDIPPEMTRASFVDIGRALSIAPFDMLGGAILDDFDGDGLLDVFTTTYDPCQPARFYRNNGDASFEDKSVAAGLERQLGGFNAQQVDYDGDGDLDVFITRGAWQKDFGRQRNSLLENDGQANFIDVTERAGLMEPSYPTQASAWADYDGDGDLDLYIGNEAADSGEPFPAQLFENLGDGRFVDRTKEAGVENGFAAKGVAWGDIEGDGDMDLFVSNIGPNRLYVNQGNGTFLDRAPALGMASSDRSFATWFWDFDNDGHLDLFVAGYQATPEQVLSDILGQRKGGARSRLYRGDGSGSFKEVGKEYGLDAILLPMGANYGDVNGDGWLDIYLGTGEPDLAAVFPNVLYLNLAGTGFVDASSSFGLGHLAKGHAVAFGDIDADGDLDLYLQAGGFVPGDAASNSLFLNTHNDDDSLQSLVDGGSDIPNGIAKHRWLTLHFEPAPADPNRFAIGARVSVQVQSAGGERVIHRQVSSGGSFGASSLRLELGLGQAESIGWVEVRWPGSGNVERFEGLSLDSSYRLKEGGGADRIEPQNIDFAELARDALESIR